jgi:hypothetical protein
MDGKGPWAQPGEYRRPKAELEAVKAERHWYEESARQYGSAAGSPRGSPKNVLAGSTRVVC